jgi:hypothetical protein
VCFVSFVTCIFPQAHPHRASAFILQLPHLSSPYGPRERRHAKRIHPQHAHCTHIRGIHRPHRQIHHARRHVRLAVPHPIPINIISSYTHAVKREGEGNKTKRTRRKTAREFRLIASSKGGAGIGLGPGIVSGVDAESETLSSPSLGRRTTLRPETGEYVLLESGVGKKARSRSK